MGSYWSSPSTPKVVTIEKNDDGKLSITEEALGQMAGVIKPAIENKPAPQQQQQQQQQQNEAKETPKETASSKAFVPSADGALLEERFREKLSKLTKAQNTRLENEKKALDEAVHELELKLS